jgi:hypothetical protein
MEVTNMEDTKEPVRDQRPFHICPDCSAYNAKFNTKCWRCERDLTAGAIGSTGVMGYRLEKLDTDARSAERDAAAGRDEPAR